MVSVIWLTRRLTMPATESKNGRLPVQSRLGDAQELAEARDHGDLGGADGEEASQNQEQ